MGSPFGFVRTRHREISDPGTNSGTGQGHCTLLSRFSLLTFGRYLEEHRQPRPLRHSHVRGHRSAGHISECSWIMPNFVQAYPNLHCMSTEQARLECYRTFFDRQVLANLVLSRKRSTAGNASRVNALGSFVMLWTIREGTTSRAKP